MSMTSIRMLTRDWRGGELDILVAALVLAVAMVTGISAFTTRLQAALEQESHRFLAADLVVRWGDEISPDWLITANEQGLLSATTLGFSSMIYAGEEAMVLASVKAVSEHYPLRGELTFSREPFGAVEVAAGGPKAGEVWLDSRLFALLAVKPGDDVGIGDTHLRVAGAVRSEPDQGVNLFSMGPRVLMHYDDIAAAAVVQPGSRVEYRQLYAGDSEQIDTFRQWLSPQLHPGQRLMDVDSGQPGIGRALVRAERFLLLAGSLAVVLAGVAIALAARRFSERHTDYVAIMKSLGATSSRINRLYGSSLLLLGVLAATLGSLAGWAVQALFFRLYAEQLPLIPGDSGLRPYGIGLVTAFVCLLCFAWPSLRRLSQASPLRILRRELAAEMRASYVDYLLGLTAVTFLMWWYSGDIRLTLAVLLGLALTVVLGMVLALALLRGGRAIGMSAGSIWRLALAGLQRRGAANALQVVIFAMAIMLLLILVLVRTSLLSQWKAQLPDNAPNHFLVNIAPDEVSLVEQTLHSQGVASETLYPMIRGRVMSINGQALPAGERDSGQRRQRGVNFTWSAELPVGNELVAGQWWNSDGSDHRSGNNSGSSEAQVSMEEGFAERFGVGVGDRVGLSIGSATLEVRIASIRKLQWQSLQPNFFMIFPPAVLAEFPATFMTSVHLNESDKPFLNRFIRQFPTITVIEMDVVVEQIRAIIDQVSTAIELVLLVILAAGSLVLVAGVRASVDERMHESSILRALGAAKYLIIGGLTIEFAALGLFAGILATLSAEVSVYVLQSWVMSMRYAPSPWLWPLGIGLGVVLITALGVYSCRKVVSSSPLAVLREL